jgi:hypothetical protein
MTVLPLKDHCHGPRNVVVLASMWKQATLWPKKPNIISIYLFLSKLRSLQSFGQAKLPGVTRRRSKTHEQLTAGPFTLTHKMSWDEFLQAVSATVGVEQENLIGHLLMKKIRYTNISVKAESTVQQLRNSVITHVDRQVAQRFNQKMRVSG